MLRKIYKYIYPILGVQACEPRIYGYLQCAEVRADRRAYRFRRIDMFHSTQTNKHIKGLPQSKLQQSEYLFNAYQKRPEI